MVGTKECKNQKGHATVPVKSHNNDLKPGHNSCGGCNACHQMTRIHSPGGSPTWDGSGGGTQKPCATNFFQRNLGNSYLQSLATGHQASGGAPTIQRKCACGGSCVSCAGKEDEEIKIQPKLTIGPVDNVYEREADRVADAVMRMSGSSMQTEIDQPTGFDIQRISSNEVGNLGAETDIKLNSVGGQPLSSSTRQFMEPRFGVDFGDVRVHTNHDSRQAASQIQARAFTWGNHVWLGKGENERDKKLMSHELTHVVQQSTVSVDGVIDKSEELKICVDGFQNPNALVSQSVPNLQIQRLQAFPEPTSLVIVSNHQIPIEQSHVTNGWRSGFGGVSEIQVDYHDPVNPMCVDYTGAKIKETFKRGSGNNAQIGGCANSSGQGRAGGSTFTVGDAVSFSQNGLNINFPSKTNTFYDVHVKGFGTNILPAGVNSQTSLCVQEYTYDGNVVGNAEFERYHNITRAIVGGQDVATIDLLKYGTSLQTP
jgi:hypothetical protein